MDAMKDLFINHMVKLRETSVDEVKEHINKCVKLISKQNDNINIRTIDNYVYNIETIANIFKLSCNLNNCNSLPGCIKFNNVCYPRYFPEANLINSDPEKWSHELSLKDLSNFLDIASYLYYNFDGGGLSDNSYDAIEYDFNKRTKLQGRRNEKIGAPPIEKLKVKLPYPMMSLTKLKPNMESLPKFLQEANDVGMVISDKLDGVSCMLVYDNNNVKIFTRGDGVYGGDVTYLHDFIKVPDLNNGYAIRGELVIEKQIWKQKYVKLYSNSRSFVSSKVNQKFISDSLKDIRFVAYSIINTPNNILFKPSEMFKELEKLGFEVVKHKIMTPSILVFTLATMLQDRRANSKYDVDGLVLALDVIEELIAGQNPSKTKAFKMTLEDQIRDTIVDHINWNISRHGSYIPVVVFKPVFIDGIRITKATGHNARYVIDRHIGNGTHIKVIRSGDVIPQIKEVNIDDSIITTLPDFTYSWHWEGPNIVLDDIENNPEVTIKRIFYFMHSIGVSGIGEVRVRNLFDKGIDTLQKITNIDIQGMNKLKIPRFTGKTTEKIYNSIHDRMRKTRIERYLIAMSLTKGIGEVTIRNLVRCYPDVFGDSSSKIEETLKKLGKKCIGIGPIKSKNIVQLLPKFMKELYKLNESDIKFAIQYQKNRIAKLMQNGYNKNIENNIFVFTGFMGNEPEFLVDFIWDNYGTIANKVSSSTKALITKSSTLLTSKIQDAVNLNIPIYNVDEFVLYFNIPDTEITKSHLEMLE